MVEEWKDIPGLEGKYQASTLGRIRSVDRYVIQKSALGREYSRFHKGRVLSPAPTHGGYLGVNIGHSDHKTVHSLVALCFLGKRPEGCEVRHLNGDKQDNRPENLRYGTHLENEQDKRNNPGKRLKLNPEQVREIKSLFETTNLSNVKIGERFGVSDVLIGQIRRGKVFAWVK